MNLTSQAELLRRLNEAQAIARIGSWNWDFATQTVWWSDELYRIFGVSPAKFTPSAEANSSFMHPEDRVRYHADVTRSIENKTALDAQLRIIAASGEVKHCHSRGQLECDAAGRPVRMFGTLHDVTPSKRAEAALRESESRYRLIVENTQEGIWQIDASSITVFANGRMAEILGRTPEEMIGKPIFEFMDDSMRALANERVERRRKGVSEEHDFKFLRKDGTEVYTLMKTDPLKDERGQYIGALAIVTDVTQRRKAIAALRESDERFRQLAASLPQLVWTCRGDGWCDYFSPRWEQYTGQPDSTQFGYGWLEQVHPDDRERVAREWQQAQQDHRPTRTEFRIRAANGTYRWFDTRAVPLFDDAGNIVRWIGSNTDIEDRRRADEARLRTQKMEALGTLAGGVAHDFNNILLAISGNAQLAIEDLPSDHPAHTSLREIKTAGARASDLVRRILTFSRHEEPKQRVIELRPTIEEALKLSRVSLPAMIELHARFAPDIPRVNADTTQLHQVIMNLTSNAAYAIGSRVGQIEVTVDAVEADYDVSRRIPGVMRRRYARISVTDNGSGMSKETLTRIFDPFFTTKPQGEGTGLGLSVVDGIMQRHDGAIRVRSEPDVGTTFELYFPEVQADVTVAPHSKQPSTPQRGLRILYVDDDEALVTLCERFLEKRGHLITCFTDPELAVRYVSEHPSDIDAVVTDLAMPKMTGFEVARSMLELNQDLPIVMMSGYLTMQDQDVAAQIGIRAVLLKPSSVDELIDVIDATLRGVKASVS